MRIYAVTNTADGDNRSVVQCDITEFHGGQRHEKI